MSFWVTPPAHPDGVAAFLPPYSPELNPKENLWEEIREKIFKNYALKSIDSELKGKFTSGNFQAYVNFAAAQQKATTWYRTNICSITPPRSPISAA